MNKKQLGLVALVLAPVAAFAQSTPANYGAVLSENLSTIDTIWGTVATIMIGAALVTVGVRFFKKAK